MLRSLIVLDSPVAMVQGCAYGPNALNTPCHLQSPPLLTLDRLLQVDLTHNVVN